MLGPSDSAITLSQKKTEKSITKAMYAHYSKILFHIVRGHVQTIFGKINVIMTLRGGSL